MISYLTVHTVPRYKECFGDYNTYIAAVQVSNFFQIVILCISVLYFDLYDFKNFSRKS